MSKYNKAIAAAVGLAATWATTYFPHSAITAALVAAAGVVAVYLAPKNKA